MDRRDADDEYSEKRGVMFALLPLRHRDWCKTAHVEIILMCIEQAIYKIR